MLLANSYSIDGYVDSFCEDFLYSLQHSFLQRETVDVYFSKFVSCQS